MKYAEVLQDAKAFETIVVSGPQRSGTTITAKMFAHDLGRPCLAEEVFGIHDESQFLELCRDAEGVLQAPSMMHLLPIVASPRVLVVVMRRAVDSIVRSQQRINWQSGDREYAKYRLPATHPEPIAVVKYRWWETQQRSFDRWREVEYDSICEHPLFVPEKQRARFKSRQTSP